GLARRSPWARSGAVGANPSRYRKMAEADRGTDLEAVLANDGETIVAAENVAARLWGHLEARTIDKPAPVDVPLELVVTAVTAQTGEAELHRVASAHAPGTVHPEGVRVLVHSKIPFEVHLVPDERAPVQPQGGVGRDPEIAGVHLEPVGQAVPRE